MKRSACETAQLCPVCRYSFDSLEVHQGRLKLGSGQHFFTEGAIKRWGGLLRRVEES